MLHEVISLSATKPWLTVEYYGNTLPGGPRDAMLIIPGGGYHKICYDREGLPIALAYLLHNRNVFVLNYSVGEKIEYPNQPLEEAYKAVQYIKHNAGRFDINAERVFVVGFSAGGHLAGWLASSYKNVVVSQDKEAGQFDGKPKGVILCYPVVSVYSEKDRWFENLFKTSPITDEQKELISLYNLVDEDTSPAFIMHSFDDSKVPVRNSIELAYAYDKFRIPFEMHVYPSSPHGIALGNQVTAMGDSKYVNAQIERWINDSCIWMEGIV